MRNNNFYTKAIIGFLTLTITFFATNTVFAQSRAFEPSVKPPKRIMNSYFKQNLKGDGRDSFYIFEVGRGVTTLKIKVKATKDNAGVNLYFKDRYDEDVVEPVLVQGNVVEGEQIETVKIRADRPMLVYMQANEIQYGSRTSYPGIMEISFSGAVIEWEN